MPRSSGRCSCPATMRLLGRWNWWMPAWLERFVGGPVAGARGRDRGGDPSEQGLAAGSAARRSCCWPLTLVIGCTATAGAPILANPTPVAPSLAAADRHARRHRRPRPGRASPRRRPARPPHRVVVRHRSSDRDGRQPLRLRVRHLPGRARRIPDLVGLAPRDHRRDRPSLRLCASGSRSVRRSIARRAIRGGPDRVRPVADRRRSVATGDRSGGRPGR